MKTIDELIRQASSMNASDVHLAAGVPPKVRIDGELQSLEEQALTADDCEQYAIDLAGDQYDQIRMIGELDSSASLGGERVRINLYREQNTVSCALRILHNIIPAIKDLGLPPIVTEFPSWQKGIILVTGETGSGKSTTLAAILDEINHTRRDHIITLEDPIEYLYTPDLCLISQREIGKDTKSYADGLRAILREDPDIILIGEMRDAETIETALTAAETGHLVFATLHTNSAVDSVDRIVGTFAADRQPQIRLQLSTTLKAVLSQQLLVKKGGGRAAACEAMIVTPAIRNQIREGKTPQMHSSMLAARNEGSITMDNCLIDMVKRNIITSETAAANAVDAEYVKSSTDSYASPASRSARKI
ncbi:MAG: PilT/PilU family type 4a pilus ATPase [Erysipelotrichia bacterium]|nr:PilT/PilU family type 4a pilus ATPase [Erysipelotrichia bacterium]